MPTRPQRALFNRLQNSFGRLGCWKALTNGQDFDAMSEHQAVHYLGYLLAAFPDLRIAATCHCGKRFYEYEHVKNPGGEPGSHEHTV